MFSILFFIFFFTHPIINPCANAASVDNTVSAVSNSSVLEANVTESNSTVSGDASEFEWVIRNFPDVYKDEESENVYEDINSVIEDPNAPQVFADKEVTGPTYSYARPPGFMYTGSKTSQMNWKYLTNKDNVCVDNIAVQQMTHLVSELSVLLPYRSVAFLNCNSPDDLPEISLPTGRINLDVYDKLYPAKIINGDRLTPGLEFYVNNKKVRVEYELESVNIISSVDLFLNIRDKKQSFKYGQFSYRNPKYKEMFTTYALSLPFSQNILLQLSPLPSFLDLEKIPSDEDRAVPGGFATAQYCKQRKCDGGSYEGKSGTPYAFQREDYMSSVFASLNKLMTKQNKGSSLIHRSIVNQKSQFENHVQYTGLFKIEAAAFVSETQEAYNKYGQNELPHELGHTYSLKDWSGSEIPNDKLVHFNLLRYLRLGLTFGKTYINDRGSMNAGGGNGILDHYTRVNRYSTIQIHNNVKKENNTFPNKFFELLDSDERSLLFAVQDIELMAFVQNAYSQPSQVLDTQPSGRHVKVELYKDSELLDTKYVPLPEWRAVVPYSWVSGPGASIVTYYNSNKKRFYLPNDVASMPRPFVSIKPSLFQQVPEVDDLIVSKTDTT